MPSSISSASKIIQQVNTPLSTVDSSKQQLIAAGRTDDSRTIKWMTIGSIVGSASMSVIGGLAAQLAVAPFAIAMIACTGDTSDILKEANDAGRIIMKPIGSVMGGLVGAGLAGTVNLTGYVTDTLMEFAHSLFADATQDASKT